MRGGYDVVVLAALLLVGCDSTPTSPTPVAEPEDRFAPTTRTVRPVDPRFDDAFWRQFVFNAYAAPDELSWRTTKVLTIVPNVWIWTLDDTHQAEEAVRRLFPRTYRELTGRPYTGRIESGPHDRNEWGWITVEFPTSLQAQRRGQALIGANPGRIKMVWDGWWHFGPGSTVGHWFFENTLQHEIGHALGFWHVSGTRDVMSVEGNDWEHERFTARERYHAQLAYEVGRGARYCGWPFSAGC